MVSLGFVGFLDDWLKVSRQKSLVADLADYPNLVVLQTLSKAWGLAGIRMGMAFASTAIVGYMNKVKPPYNISQPVQELALKALDEIGQVNDMIVTLVNERQQMERLFSEMTEVKHVYPSDANFLLVKFKDAASLYTYLVADGIVVRDRSNVEKCAGCLRITIGTPAENEKLIQSIFKFNKA
jgi:histidinol-phosphate aminotransferase